MESNQPGTVISFFKKRTYVLVNFYVPRQWLNADSPFWRSCLSWLEIRYHVIGGAFKALRKEDKKRT